ncbi:excinuclease ABC subunit UvrA [Paenibacillus arenosi]|uniref:UvrABC system protein A n=1 Tax=Paenibacillus arenosi TaxID=2774142 RepID=A0ABR9AZ90_9BACL|nr:excinuclease ABC subunit UvrA [Paenibacillus arenosi]MBD8499456.1 excinuclease ABC subunit UvrA [Paenibacillus arenosi]
MFETIKIKGAREHNLKNVTLEIPKHKFVVLTGPSGSGKSTLAMETLQKECQRQYMESMGMITDSFTKPKVDSITGLSPSISVGQHVTNRNPRSTVGTVTDIHQFLRFVYARAGKRPCPSCGEMVEQATDAAADSSMNEEEEREGKIICPSCSASLPKLTMRHFSFNTPEGACGECSGLGEVASLNIDAVFDLDKSLREGGVVFLNEGLIEYYGHVLVAAGKHYGFEFDLDLPLRTYTEAAKDLLYYGAESEEFSRHYPTVQPPKTVSKGKFEGIITGMWRRYKEKDGDAAGASYGHAGVFFTQQTCQSCHGKKLNADSRSVQVYGASISDISSWSLQDVYQWISDLSSQLTEQEQILLQPIMEDLPNRLKRIVDVGLSYLSLDRQTITLSGGEAQRLRLATLLGSGLTGVLYVLDEPSRGLHPKDTEGLISVLLQLRDMGNTVLVIEHDPEMMRAADHVIDMGPGAGSRGGEVVGEGTLEQLKAIPASVTGAYLREEELPSPPRKRRKGNGRTLTIHNAHLRNLRHIDVSFPLGVLSSVTGVSGSGKSTLMFDLLAEGGIEHAKRPGCDRIEGLEHIGELILADQSPIGRMQRSNVATYTDVFTQLRNLFAGLPEAKKQKLTSKHFSFNTAGGRCENCQGLGVVTLDMNFLPDMEVTCKTCKGRRFKEEVLAVTYKDHSISDLLDMSIEDSLEIFASEKKVASMIELLCEVGLGYLHWGQSVRTLSGGEGQRLKLAKELSKKTKKHTLYLLDEPSTGLHPKDAERLLILLQKLVDADNTVILVEHNMELVRESDWVVDLGPEGGAAGGQLMAAGTPEQVAEVAHSQTAKYLEAALSKYRNN